jgi:3-(methylthio)propanoyl-CoA dehydrogenase
MRSIVNYYTNETEWQWLFKNAVDWKNVLPLYYPKYPTEEGFETPEEVIKFLEEILINTGDWAFKSLTPRATILDKVGPGTVENGKTLPNEHLKATYSEAAELGVYGLCLPKKYGGMELPPAVVSVLMGQVARACTSTMTQLSFFYAIADMVNRFGAEEDKERIIPKIISGEISGAMCLTEAGAGSDVGSLRTSAELQPDGSYLINGSKIFITNGGGGVQLVLARIKGEPEGLKGISMFLVEQEIPGKEGLNFKIVKNEEKMGLHGSFTTEVLYENTVGKLMGVKNLGFTYMLHLMNAARLACGIQSVGGIEAALSYAKNYAQERKQFGKPIAELPLMKRNLEDFETERDALRALLMDTITYVDIFQKLDLKKAATNDLTQEEETLYQDSKIWVRKRTPLLKYYGTEAFTALSTKAIQVLGGYGFMKDYPVERIHRDSFAPLLYEGTSQIQALMALKDLIKYAMGEPRKFFANIFFKHPTRDLLKGSSKWEKDFREDHYNFKKKLVRMLLKKLNPPKNMSLLNPKKWVTEEKINGLMENAETLCQGLSYMETLRVLAAHANIDSTRSDLFYRYRRLVCPRLESIYTDWSIR